MDISEEFFNSIFLSTSILKYPVLKVNEGEFETLRGTGSGSYISPRTFLGAPKIGSSLRNDIFIKKIIIKKSELEIILKLADKLYKSKFKFGMFTFYDGYTKFYYEDYTASFIFNWMTIEYYISMLLEDYFVEKKVFKELIDRLNRDWNVRIKMRYLVKKGNLNEKDYKIYNKQRKIRNRIVHSEYKPTREESNECKDISYSVIKKVFKEEGIDIDHFLSEIKKLK